ncbi:MAG: hypothetical protein J7M38_04670, partial [Armatimonadetes bacterium]|nr:hypothetical protein [Armatimonadota bacterium]
MLRVRAIWSVLMVAACCGVLAAGGSAAAEDQGRSLLSSTAPGAFGVRYLPDRAIMTYTVAAPDGQDEDEDFGLTLYLPRAPKWLLLDQKRLDTDAARWLEASSQVSIDLPFGSHRLQLGWAGSGKLPPRNARIPIMVNGRKKGELRVRFSL